MILADISSHLSGDLIGDSSVQIDHINTLHEAKEGQLTFVLEKKYISLAQQSSASAFITFKHIDGLANQIIVQNPKKALSQVILLFKKSITESYTKKHHAIISQTSTISTTANLGEGCSVGNNSIISNLVTIGKNCIIGNDVMIYPNVTLYDNTIIGNHVIIHSGAVIGSDGFGYYQDANQWFKVPHIGYVQLDDHVEIGANTCIDRGCIGLTHIMSGCKIDNLVHIAHNTIIEPHVAVAAQVGVTGSTRIGDHVIIGGQAGIDANHIGSHAIIAGKAGVTKDVSEHEMVSGFPAWSHKKELKKQAFIRHLMRSHI